MRTFGLVGVEGEGDREARTCARRDGTGVYNITITRLHLLFLLQIAVACVLTPTLAYTLDIQGYPDTGQEYTGYWALFTHFCYDENKIVIYWCSKSLSLAHRIKDKVLIPWTKIFACILQTLYCDFNLLGHNPLSHVNHWFDLLIIVFMIIRNLLWSIEILLNYND